MNSNEEVDRILATLRIWHEEICALRDAGDRLRDTRSAEVDAHFERLRAIKKELRDAAKHETIDGTKRPKTELEQWSYGPAVRQAAANFRMRTDAPPSKWRSGLADPECDLSHAIYGLEAHTAKELE